MKILLYFIILSSLLFSCGKKTDTTATIRDCASSNFVASQLTTCSQLLSTYSYCLQNTTNTNSNECNAYKSYVNAIYANVIRFGGNTILDNNTSLGGDIEILSRSRMGNGFDFRLGNMTYKVCAIRNNASVVPSGQSCSGYNVGYNTTPNYSTFNSNGYVSCSNSCSHYSIFLGGAKIISGYKGAYRSIRSKCINTFVLAGCRGIDRDGDGTLMYLESGNQLLYTVIQGSDFADKSLYANIKPNGNADVELGVNLFFTTINSRFNSAVGYADENGITLEVGNNGDTAMRIEVEI
jgi:hypothetical protein